MQSQVHIMPIQQRHEEVQREIATNRLGRKLRARGGESRLAWDLKWDLARYAGLSGKRLRGTG